MKRSHKKPGVRRFSKSMERNASFDDRLIFSTTARTLYAMTEEERSSVLEWPFFKVRMIAFESERRKVASMTTNERETYFRARNEKAEKHGKKAEELRDLLGVDLEKELYEEIFSLKGDNAAQEKLVQNRLSHSPELVACLKASEAAGLKDCEKQRLADAAFVEEQKKYEDDIIVAYEKRKAKAQLKPGKGTSRHAGEKFLSKGNVSKYYVRPDGQHVEVNGDGVVYKITSKAALEALDRLLDAVDNGEGWAGWSRTDRARFSAASAKAFAKKYIETKSFNTGEGALYYPHQPQARLRR